MNSTYKLAAILLGSALLAQPHVQASDKMPDMSTASRAIIYCAHIECWQEKPCLQHQEGETLKSIQPAKAASKVSFPASIVVGRFPTSFGRDRNDARYWAPIIWSPTS